MNVSATVKPLQVGICVTSDVQSAIEITVVQAGKVADTAVLVQFLHSIM